MTKGMMKRRKSRFFIIASVAAISLFGQGATGTGSRSSRIAPRQTREATWDASTAGGVAAEGDWPMAGANPERTSWSSEEVRGSLDPLWYRPIEPYISYKAQVIAANGLLYISTATGLYALDAESGSVTWMYATELPLGHSATVQNGIAYVGGYDKKIHAVDATPDADTLPIDPETGYRINDRIVWVFDAQEQSEGLSAGFDTNPLVVNGTVYAGNRDGCMYAVDAAEGSLEWRFETGGPVLFSAAYKDGVVYLASNDSHAYALNATDGTLVWKSAKLPGAGFHSYWPVVYQDYVILAGSNNYRLKDWQTAALGSEPPVIREEWDELYPNYELDPSGTLIGPEGTEPGDWVSGTVTIDVGTPNCTKHGCTKPITEYLEEKPWRRTVFVLDRFTGDEFTFDSDQDGNPEYAPFVWFGTHSGNRYPPVVGSDGVLYQANNYLSDQSIPAGQAVGWKLGTSFVSRVSGDWHGVVEPPSYSAGGDVVYWTNCVDREAGAYDITAPYGSVLPSSREWKYFDYNIDEKIPGYDIAYSSPIDTNKDYNKVFGNQNGIYGTHGVQNPVVPYNGKVYLHRGNAVIAFGDTGDEPVQLPLVRKVAVQDSLPTVTADQLRQQLAVEVEKMLDAGHLRPGYHSTGIADSLLGTHLADYFHNPADTLYTLVRTMPHLSLELQQRTREYLEQEFADYPPYDFAHIGWRDGTAREAFDLPPEIEAQRDSFSPQTESAIGWWDFPQHSFYGLWKYAEEFGGADEILVHIQDKVETPPSDDYLTKNPHVHNSYIAGYIGYLELQRLAEETKDPNVEAELSRLLALRAANFTKDSPFTEGEVDYHRALNVSRNFMYLVPELADYLRDKALVKVEGTIDGYSEVAPCWFVSKYDSTYAQGVLQHLYDYHSMFQAKALILRESRGQLLKYLDVPAFQRGDLFYIQNLVAAIEDRHDLEKTATPSLSYQGGSISYTLSFFGGGTTLTLTDTLPLGAGAPGDFELEGTTVTPTYNRSEHRLLWSDTPEAGREVAIHYTTIITAADHRALVNTAELSGAVGEASIATATITANPKLIYLPMITKKPSETVNDW